MPRLIPSRSAAACLPALFLFLLLALTGTASAANKVEADLRVVGAGGKVLAEDSLRSGTTTIPTSRKADCFGKGSGGSGQGMKVKGSTALGLLATASRTTSSLRPLLITDAFDFGLGICGVGGSTAGGKLSWYLKVNHKNPELGGELGKVRPGDEVLWALAGFQYPKELSLEAPAEATPGAVEVRVFSSDDRGRRKPAKGAKVNGAAARTEAQGGARVAG